MCLLFLYLNPNAGSSEYKVIIANNRDEFFHRPTKPAHFWPEILNVIGGTDQETGKEGGTWFAINRNGRISCVLNILQPRTAIHPHKKGRGFLVNNFVQGSTSAIEYLKNVAKESSEYNGFLLITLDVFSNPVAAYYTNKDDDEPIEMKSGFYVFGNSPPARLWEKCIQGKKLFKKVIRETSDNNDLVKQLMSLLKNTTVYPLDDQIESQGKGLPRSVLEKKNSIFYSIPEINYGTRSHTIILIDGDNNVEYIESCMEDPIEINGKVNWVNTKEVFSLECSDSSKTNKV